MKTCSKCKVSKDWADFYSDKRSKSGLKSECIKCAKAFQASYRQRHPERGERWHKEHPHYRLLTLYGISSEEYERLFSEQKGVCEICKTPHKKLVVDHDHVTGKIRALLCRKCNSGIGMLGDSSERVLLAASYLKKYLTK